MSDAQSLTLPNAASRSRRVRLPRPPRFTRGQKFNLALDLALGVVDVFDGFVATPAGAVFVVALALDVRTTIRDAHGRRQSGHPDRRREVLFNGALFVTSGVLLILGFGR